LGAIRTEFGFELNSIQPSRTPAALAGFLPAGKKATPFLVFQAGSAPLRPASFPREEMISSRTKVLPEVADELGVERKPTGGRQPKRACGDHGVSPIK